VPPGVLDQKRSSQSSSQQATLGMKAATSMVGSIQARGWCGCCGRWFAQLMCARITVLAQQTYASDPKYKKYAQQVDRCLNSFDSVHEWADFIAFLKQLLKVRDGITLASIG
jgi:Dopey, N-terminal